MCTDRGEIPMTVAVFVNPGDHPEYVEHRSLEYDTVSDRYVTFLVSPVAAAAAPHIHLICVEPR